MAFCELHPICGFLLTGFSHAILCVRQSPFPEEWGHHFLFILSQLYLPRFHSHLISLLFWCPTKGFKLGGGSEKGLEASKNLTITNQILSLLRPCVYENASHTILYHTSYLSRAPSVQIFLPGVSFFQIEGQKFTITV